jgi:hypothetical protein
MKEREFGTQVISALRQVEAELAAGALLSIDTQRARLRLLPLIRQGKVPQIQVHYKKFT